MDPDIWGPTFWKLIHAASFEASVHDFAGLVNCLQHLLPCVHCRNSFNLYLQRYPVSCMGTDSAAASKWTWKIHDHVDLKLNQSTIAYTKLRRRCMITGACVSDEEVWSFLFICILNQLSAPSSPPWSIYRHLLL